jgi:negative regulator of flagellin synthesis FlgM
MKISDASKDLTAQLVQQYQKNDNYVAANANSDKQAVATAVRPEEKVDLSTQAKDIQQAKNALSAVPDIREGKVQEIKSQVNKGTYNVSAEKIAGKMVGESIVDIFA